MINERIQKLAGVQRLDEKGKPGAKINGDVIMKFVKTASRYYGKRFIPQKNLEWYFMQWANDSLPSGEELLSIHYPTEEGIDAIAKIVIDMVVTKKELVIEFSVVNIIEED
jgi:hypothetical protein